MSRRLSPVEQETVILWDNELDSASIYTHDARMIRKLTELAEKYPKVYVLERTGPGKAVTYRLPKSLISLRAPYDEERRQKQREQALQNNYLDRFQAQKGENE